MLLLTLLALSTFLVLPGLAKILGRILGWSLRKKTEGRRAHLLALMTEEDKAAREADPKGTTQAKLVFDVDDKLRGTLESQKGWAGIVGFFHPFWYVGASLCWDVNID